MIIHINPDDFITAHEDIAQGYSTLTEVSLSWDELTSTSVAMDAFKNEANRFKKMVDSYCALLKQDVAALKESATLFMDLDNDQAKKYEKSIGESLEASQTEISDKAQKTSDTSSSTYEYSPFDASGGSY